MIRKVLTAQNQDVSLKIPANYVGKQIEVIVFAMDEGIVENIKYKFTHEPFSELKLDTKNIKFTRDEANQR